MGTKIITKRPRRENRDWRTNDVTSVIFGGEQVEITGIDPPIAFRCGGKVYTECPLPYIKTLMDREWETGLIDGRSIDDPSIQNCIGRV